MEIQEEGKMYRSLQKYKEIGEAYKGTTETRQSEDNLEILAPLPTPFITPSQTHSLSQLLQNKLNIYNHC